MDAAQQIRESLEPDVGTFEVFERARDELLKDSRLWILEEQSFKAWVDAKIPLLLIYGLPGAGKSFLSCRIVQILCQVYPQDVKRTASTSVAYFFCKSNSTGLRSYRSMILTLAYQITKNDPTYANHIHGLKVSIKDCRSIKSLWQMLFVDFFTRKECDSKAIMVVDGLDEADQELRPLFLKLMSKISSNEHDGHSMRILLVGRPEIIEELDDAIGHLPPSIEINPTKNSADIQRFIEDAVANSKLKR